MVSRLLAGLSWETSEPLQIHASAARPFWKTILNVIVGCSERKLQNVMLIGFIHLSRLFNGIRYCFVVFGTLSIVPLSLNMFLPGLPRTADRFCLPAARFWRAPGIFFRPGRPIFLSFKDETDMYMGMVLQLLLQYRDLYLHIYACMYVCICMYVYIHVYCLLCYVFGSDFLLGLFMNFHRLGKSNRFILIINVSPIINNTPRSFDY